MKSTRKWLVILALVLLGILVWKWLKSDSAEQSVTAGTPDAPDETSFDSGLLTPGTNFEVSFEEPGVYSLFCSLHPDMVATVQVTD